MPNWNDPNSIKAWLAKTPDRGKAEHALASTIVDLTGTSPRILRVGAVSAESIAEVLGTSPESLVEGVS